MFDLMYPPAVINRRELQFILRWLADRGYPLDGLKLTAKTEVLRAKYSQIYYALNMRIPLGANEVVYNTPINNDYYSVPTTHLTAFKSLSPWKYVNVLTYGYYDALPHKILGGFVYAIACERPRV